MKSVQGFSSGVEKNLMVHSLRDFSATHILEGAYMDSLDIFQNW